MTIRYLDGVDRALMCVAYDIIFLITVGLLKVKVHPNFLMCHML